MLGLGGVVGQAQFGYDFVVAVIIALIEELGLLMLQVRHVQLDNQGCRQGNEGQLKRFGQARNDFEKFCLDIGAGCQGG